MTTLKIVGLLGVMIVSLRLYLSVLPLSPVLGALVVVAVGGLVAMVYLDLGARLEEAHQAGEGELPPGG